MSKKILLIATAFPPRIGSGAKRLFSIANNLSFLGWDIYVLTLEKGYYDFREEDLSFVFPKVQVFRTKAWIPKPENILGKIIMAFSHLILIPDRFLVWLPFGFKKGLEIIKKEKINIIYSSAPSFSVHLLARKLKRETGIKWVAEFRDPWTENIAFKKKFFIKRFIERKMERNVLKDSDLIISVAENIEESLKRALGFKNKEKFHIITNGFNIHD